MTGSSASPRAGDAREHKAASCLCNALQYSDIHSLNTLRPPLHTRFGTSLSARRFEHSTKREIDALQREEEQDREEERTAEAAEERIHARRQPRGRPAAHRETARAWRKNL